MKSCKIYCSKIEMHIFFWGGSFILGIKCCMALDWTIPDPMQHATLHSSSPTTTSKFSPVLHVPRLKQKQITLRTSWRDAFQAEWTHLQTCESCFRHSSRSGWPSQRRWFTTWSSPCLRDAGQLLILEEDTPLTDTRVSQLQNTEWLNFSLDEKSVKIINFDLNQLQNKMWWTRFLVEFSNKNSILKQTKYECLFFFSFFKQCIIAKRTEVCCNCTHSH